MKKIFTILFSVSLLVIVSCDSGELDFSITPSIGFATPFGSILENNTNGIKVKLYSNVRIETPVVVNVSIINFQGLQYGVDYTTDPAPSGNTLTVELSGDDTDPGFFVFPVIKPGAPDKRSLSFEISGVEGGNLQPGQSASLVYKLDITKIQPIQISYDFNSCVDFATPSGFIEVFEPGSKTDRGWGCRAFGLNATRAPRASGFGGTAGDDKAWMILNPITIPQGATVQISFWVYSNFSGPGTISAKWSSDYSGAGNPLTAGWTDLSTLNSQYPAAGSKVWKKVEATYTNISGNQVYFGIQFTGANNTASASWDIDDFLLSVQ